MGKVNRKNGHKIDSKPAKDKNLAEQGLGVKMKGSAKKGHEIVVTRDGGLTGLFGTDDPDQATALISQCLKALAGTEAGDAGECSDERQFMLSIINDMAPRDGIERMLAVQMAATHVAMIRSGGRLARSDQLPQYEAHDRAYNKLARTFSAQMEALRKHRNGGKQAIVGNVQTGGRGRDEK